MDIRSSKNFVSKFFFTKNILLGLINLVTKLLRDILSMGHFMLRTMDSRTFIHGRLILEGPITPSIDFCHKSIKHFEYKSICKENLKIIAQIAIHDQSEDYPMVRHIALSSAILYLQLFLSILCTCKLTKLNCCAGPTKGHWHCEMRCHMGNTLDSQPHNGEFLADFFSVASSVK